MNEQDRTQAWAALHQQIAVWLARIDAWREAEPGSDEEEDFIAMICGIRDQMEATLGAAAPARQQE